METFRGVALLVKYTKATEEKTATAIHKQMVQHATLSGACIPLVLLLVLLLMSVG